MNTQLIRPAGSDDQAQIVHLIDTIFQEYNDRVCLDGVDSDLVNIDGEYLQNGGQFWVLDDGQRVVGTHAALPTAQPGICTFRRLYLARHLRGESWGRRLMENNIEWAVANGFRRVEFWSDTRFSRAHRFFEKLGFRRGEHTRRVENGWQPFEEYFYSLEPLV